MKTTYRDSLFYALLGTIWVGLIYWIPRLLGPNGLYGDWFTTNTLLKFSVLFIGLSHLTIVAMSLAFHRSHTHQAVKFNPIIDGIMQTWLWMMTSMSKLDWVSVHVYHHTYSDTEKDPHSPVQKGLARVFFCGVVDYSRAKTWPEVLKIRNRIPTNAYERYIARHLFQAPMILAGVLMVCFGPLYGTIFAAMNFAISPLFAVGGVNALAHSIGYQNYDAKDESRNLGFLFFLNWIISGELDHNNHHKYPKSPSFAHRWFEFDIGWIYIRMLRQVGLAKVTGKIPKYAPAVASEISVVEPLAELS
ncbi:MAG: fatty acid desaturase [Bdellovibrionales bacterium]|nr:fatty acid desaturase [Bdellovibrionales bacterium]